MPNLQQLEAKIGYRFADSENLKQALTHRSLNHDNDNIHDYEKLEFLGDRVLGLCLADALFYAHQDAEVGDIARHHASLVSGEMLFNIACDIALADYIMVTTVEKKQLKKSILVDSCEALIGAIYIDTKRDFSATKNVVLNLWDSYISTTALAPKDARSRLQEWAQGHKLPKPDYVVIEQTGEVHEPTFTVEVSICGVADKAKSQGKSKKLAKQGAAEKLCQLLQI